MVRELTIMSPQPLDLIHVVTGAAAVDPAHGLRSVLDDGATQIVDADGALLATVFRTRGIEVRSEILRLLGRADDDWHFRTEVFVPDGASRGEVVASRIAAEVDGDLVAPV